MAVADTSGSVAKQQPSGGISLGQECHLVSYEVTAPSDTGVTGFDTTIPGLDENTKVVGLVPMESTAGALTGVYATVGTNLLTINHASANLAGTEKFHVTFMQQIG